MLRPVSLSLSGPGLLRHHDTEADAGVSSAAEFPPGGAASQQHGGPRALHLPPIRPAQVGQQKPRLSQCIVTKVPVKF